MSTTPVNIETSDKRLERSPPLACISPRFLARIWSAKLRNHCISTTSAAASIVPVILYKWERSWKKGGGNEKNEKRRRKRWNESPVSKTSSLFIRSKRLQLSDYAIYKRARYIESSCLWKRNGRSREMQVDNDAGGYTGWVRAKKLEELKVELEVDIIWFIIIFFFFRKSRRYMKMSVSMIVFFFNEINFIDKYSM